MKNKVSNYFKEFVEILKRKEMSILPAHLAYYLLLSTIPALTIIFFIVSRFNITLETMAKFMSSMFSPDVVETLINVISTTSLNASNVFFFLIAFYITSNGSRSIIVASNTVFNVYESTFFKRMIKSFILTVIMIMLITFIVSVPLFGSTILKLLSNVIDGNKVIYVLKAVFPFLKWPLTLIILFMFIKLLYTLAPDERIPSSYVNKGTIFTTISWTLITIIYSFYINNIAAYDKFYGALAVVIILLLWYWLLSYAFVIGLVMNYRNAEAEIEKTNSIKLNEIKEKIQEDKLNKN